jgi:hypothetical protein
MPALVKELVRTIRQNGPSQCRDRIAPGEVSFPNFLARQVLSRVPLAIAGISQKPSRDYKSSFLIKEEFLTNQDDVPV